MRHSIIVISIVVGMIAAALVAVDNTGVVAAVPERVSATQRGIKGINSKPKGRQRSNPAGRPRDDDRVTGLYAGVRLAFRYGKTAIEEAMYAVGIATPPRKDRFAVVSVDLPDGYRHALVYHVDNPTYRKLQRVLRGSKHDPVIVAYGRDQNVYSLPVEVGEGFHAGFVNPSFVIVKQVDRKGRFDPTQNVVVDGRRVEVRARCGARGQEGLLLQLPRVRPQDRGLRRHLSQRARGDRRGLRELRHRRLPDRRGRDRDRPRRRPSGSGQGRGSRGGVGADAVVSRAVVRMAVERDHPVGDPGKWEATTAERPPTSRRTRAVQPDGPSILNEDRPVGRNTR